MRTRNPLDIYSVLFLLSLANVFQPPAFAGQTVSPQAINKLLTPKQFVASNGLTLPYRIYHPSITSPKTSLPLLVFLHGRGERGTDNRPAMFNNVGLFTGENSILSAENRQRFPAVILIPQCSDKTPHEEWARWYGNSAEQPFAGLGRDGSYQQHPQPSLSGAAALELIDATISQYKLDRERIYITGVSMGGFGTWDFISRRPDLFAAAIPMAGFSDPTTAETIQHIPIWSFHGEKDEYNPVDGSRIITHKLQTLGAEVHYTEFNNTKHSETFKQAWQNPNILPWLFSKKKVKVEKRSTED